MEVPLDSQEWARNVVDILSARFGSDIVLLDLQGLTIIADYFIIATGDSDRQLAAMAEDLVQKVREQQGERPLAVEGSAASGWVLVDYGSIVVHLFSEAQRARYQLEDLWQGARTVVRIA